MAVSQINRAIIRPVTIAAAIIGSIQALAWTGLSLVSILYYISVILIDDLPENSYGKIIYQLFLDRNSQPEDDVIVTPTVFFIFMAIIVFSNFFWLVASLYILWAMTRNRWKYGFHMVGKWSALTLLIAITDIVLMSLIAADFNTVLSTVAILNSETTSTISTAVTTTIFPEESTTSPLDTSIDDSTTITPDSSTVESTTIEDSARRLFRVEANYLNSELDASKHIKYAAYAIIMSVAARGYILLILNITFAIILIKFAFVIRNDETPSLLPSDAYTTSVRPWNNLYEQTDINSYSNGAFRDDNDQTAFPRSDSFITNDKEIRNFNPLSNGTNPYVQNIERNQPSPPNPNIVEDFRLAKIGKKSGNRTPPRNVPPPVIPNMPYIPDPDYTPPGSPKAKPKSVLRPKSNYVL